MPQPSDDEIRRRYGLPPGTRTVRSRGPIGEPVRLDPDEFHYRELDSELHRADWDRPVAVAGTTVHLAVRGVAVGEGSPVGVVLKDARNKTVGRGAGAMYRDRAVVAVEVDRRAAAREPDGVLCAADVRLPELGLEVVSGPLRVLPFAELVRAEWGRAEARDGDVVALSCRVTGSGAGVKRLARETAEVEISRGDEGEGALFEPVAALRVPIVDGRVEAAWRVGLEAGAKGRIATQGELDAAAARTGAEPARYARPAWRFRVRAGGLEAESGELGYRDWAELLLLSPGGAPCEGLRVTVERPDGEQVEVEVGAEGTVRIEPAPPGPYHIAEVSRLRHEEPLGESPSEL